MLAVSPTPGAAVNCLFWAGMRHDPRFRAFLHRPDPRTGQGLAPGDCAWRGGPSASRARPPPCR